MLLSAEQLPSEGRCAVIAFCSGTEMCAATGHHLEMDPTREPMALPDLAVWHLLSPGAAALALMSGFGFLVAPSHQSLLHVAKESLWLC